MTVFEQGLMCLAEAQTKHGDRKYYWVIGTPGRAEIFAAATCISSLHVPPHSRWNRVKAAMLRFFRRSVADMSFCGYPAYWMPRLVDREVFLVDGKRIAGRFIVEDRRDQ